MDSKGRLVAHHGSMGRSAAWTCPVTCVFDQGSRRDNVSERLAPTQPIKCVTVPSNSFFEGIKFFLMKLSQCVDSDLPVSLNRPGFVGDFILWKRGWNHGQTQQDRSKVFG
jgi:hypothetical protein